jgi:hypothetical protein
LAKHWTKEEITYLEERWGESPIPYIAKRLNRSVEAVKLKAARLGLGRHLHSGDYVTLNQLMKALGRRQVTGYDITSFVEKRGFPVREKTSYKRSYRVVYLDEFWEWAEKNRAFIDFSKVERGILGKEPPWVEDQRKADELYALYNRKPWTKKEDSILKTMLNAYRYSYRDISVRLRRTEGAIKRRILDLGLKQRPLKADTHNPWTEEEERKLIELYNKGYRPEVMAEFIERSALAIRGKIERMQMEGRKELIERGVERCQPSRKSPSPIYSGR